MTTQTIPVLNLSDFDPVHLSYKFGKYGGTLLYKKAEFLLQLGSSPSESFLVKQGIQYYKDNKFQKLQQFTPAALVRVGVKADADYYKDTGGLFVDARMASESELNVHMLRFERAAEEAFTKAYNEAANNSTAAVTFSPFTRREAGFDPSIKFKMAWQLLNRGDGTIASKLTCAFAEVDLKTTAEFCFGVQDLAAPSMSQITSASAAAKMMAGPFRFVAIVSPSIYVTAKKNPITNSSEQCVYFSMKLVDHCCMGLLEPLASDSYQPIPKAPTLITNFHQ